MILKLSLTIGAAFAFAEFVGYWLHVLLHNEKIPFLSRTHLLHHLVAYARIKRAAKGGRPEDEPYDDHLFIGLEWVLPVGAIISLAQIALRSAGFAPLLQIVFIAASFLWGLFMFTYMHQALHEESFWMEGNGLLRELFLRARRRHHIHHLDLDGGGRIGKNYGILFFFFDDLFGSLDENDPARAEDGVKAAFKHYSYLRR